MNPNFFYMGVLLILLVFLLALFFFRERQEKSRVSFSLPSPPFDRNEWNRFSTEIVDLGFRLAESLDKLLYGLWPSPMNAYIHDVFEAFAELSLYPCGKFQIQFISLFPGGSITTVAGQKLITLRFLSSADWISWASGNIVSVWEEHMKQVARYQEENNVAPVVPTRDVYFDFIHLFKNHVHQAVAENLLVPKTVHDSLTLGFAKLDLLKGREALEMFDLAINLEPENSYLCWVAGKVALFLFDFKSAARYFQKAVKINPKDKESWILLGETWMFLAKGKEAYETLKEARQIFPEENNFSMRLGLVAMKIGKLKEARAYLEEVSNSGGASVTLFRALAKLHVQMGDFKKAKQYYRLGRVFAREREDWGQLPWRQKGEL